MHLLCFKDIHSLYDTIYCTTSFYSVQLTMDDGSSETCLDWFNNTNFKNFVWFIKAIYTLSFHFHARKHNILTSYLSSALYWGHSNIQFYPSPLSNIFIYVIIIVLFGCLSFYLWEQIRSSMCKTPTWKLKIINWSNLSVQHPTLRQQVATGWPAICCVQMLHAIWPA